MGGGGSDQLRGPDLTLGIAFNGIKEEEPLLGHAHGEAVLLVRRGEELFAIGATCTHYGGPLAEGLVSGETIRCPWHHACFSVRTGEALAAPAHNPVPCFAVRRAEDKVFVGAKKEPPPIPLRTQPSPKSVVVLGAGAAGHAAAEMLRREGYVGKVTLVGADDALPVDRPNLSKDYLAGTAPEEWIPIRPRDHYEALAIDLMLGAEALAIDTATKEIALSHGRTLPYDALILATGAEPVKLAIRGGDLPHVHTLRTLADSRAIIAASAGAARAVVIGASFIGLEVAAALRARNMDVHVVSPESRPLERVLGPTLGDFVRGLHEEKGVKFHLEEKPKAIDAKGVTLESGERIEASLVVVGIGVRPNTALAEKAGIKVDRGVLVNEYLETSVPSVFAAGDIARYPDARSGALIRIEHWVVAQRQGQVAARNVLGKRERYAFIPFFWSQHYDVPINYVGHAKNGSGWMSRATLRSAT
jgi:NADPH-dependent 2,4-dienoyl-CoA reductase/sulfur reductase-like enzyme/nitrite reductase/ring-hydroxylating ferredoxin subunit